MIEATPERSGGWVRIVMAEPPGNLLSLELIRRLQRAISEAAQRPGLRWLTLESAADDFSFGAKIQEHLPEPIAKVLPETHRLLKDLLRFPAPTAALVRGRCLGGAFELALACDDIIASADATFGFPEIRLCAFPPAGAALLPARVGASRATRAVVTGHPQSAEYWHLAGLISLVNTDVSLLSAAGDWFDRHFASRSAVGLSLAAEAARLVLRAQVEPAIDAAERLYLQRLVRTRDALEGVEAWIDKRAPKWEDR